MRAKSHDDVERTAGVIATIFPHPICCEARRLNGAKRRDTAMRPELGLAMVCCDGTIYISVAVVMAKGLREW